MKGIRESVPLRNRLPKPSIWTRSMMAVWGLALHALHGQKYVDTRPLNIPFEMNSPFAVVIPSTSLRRLHCRVDLCSFSHRSMSCEEVWGAGGVPGHPKGVQRAPTSARGVFVELALHTDAWSCWKRLSLLVPVTEHTSIRTTVCSVTFLPRFRGRTTWSSLHTVLGKIGGTNFAVGNHVKNLCALSCEYKRHLIFPNVTLPEELFVSEKCLHVSNERYIIK